MHVELQSKLAHFLRKCFTSAVYHYSSWTKHRASPVRPCCSEGWPGWVGLTTLPWNCCRSKSME